MGGNNFGASVIGEEAAAQNALEDAAGASVFGTRVRSELQHEVNAADSAKANSEFGARVAIGATHTELSEEDIRKILDTVTGNPTYLDSLYEGELARPGGPRQEVIRFMYEVERGIKGQMRESIMRQMRAILGETDATAAATAAAGRAMVQRDIEIAQRSEENKQLVDAPRAASLAKRAKDLQAVQDAGGDLQAGSGNPASIPDLADLTKAKTDTSTATQVSDPNAANQQTDAKQEKVAAMDRDALEAEATRLKLPIDDGKGGLTDGRYSVDELRTLVYDALVAEDQK